MKPNEPWIALGCPTCNKKCYWIKKGKDWVMVLRTAIKAPLKVKRDDQGWPQLGRLKQHMHT